MINIPLEKCSKIYYGFINKKGDEVVPIDYYSAENFSEGMAKVYNGKYGFINKKGKEVVPLIYYYVENFSEGLAMVGKDGKYGFINKNGEFIIPMKFRW